MEEQTVTGFCPGYISSEVKKDLYTMRVLGKTWIAGWNFRFIFKTLNKNILKKINIHPLHKQNQTCAVLVISDFDAPEFVSVKCDQSVAKSFHL